MHGSEGETNVDIYVISNVLLLRATCTVLSFMLSFQENQTYWSRSGFEPTTQGSVLRLNRERKKSFYPPHHLCDSKKNITKFLSSKTCFESVCFVGVLTKLRHLSDLETCTASGNTFHRSLSSRLVSTTTTSLTWSQSSMQATSLSNHFFEVYIAAPIH